MDTDLDDQLNAAAPPVAPRTPALRNALAELVERTEAASTTTRIPRRVGVGIAALALTAVAGVGTAAAAGVIGWGPNGWWNEPDAVTHYSRTDSGEQCRITFGPREVRDPSHPVSARDRAAAMAAAVDFLRGFDYTTVDALTSDEAFVEVNDRATEALERQGLSIYAVSIGMASDCESGTEQ